MILDRLLLPPMSVPPTSHDFGHVFCGGNQQEEVTTLIFPGNCQSPRLRLRKRNSVVVRYVRGDVRRSIENGRRAYAFCRERSHSVRVVCFSLGAGLFAEAYCPATWQVSSVTLFAPLPNLRDLAKRKVGSLLAALFVGNHQLATTDNLQKKLRRNTPCAIVHGTEDGVIPHELSVDMFLRLRESGKNVRFRSLQGRGHNDLPWLVRG